MTRLVLHIGHHKTGSTALQTALSNSRSALRERSVLYPRLPGWRHIHHALFPHFFGNDHCDPYILRRLGGSPERALARSEAAWHTLCREVQRRRIECVILSSETFFTAGHPAQMERLGDILRQLADDIEVVCYVRHPADFVLSSFSTQIQLDARFQWPPTGIRRGVLENYQYAAPVKLHVVQYDGGSLPHGNVISDFSHRLLADRVPLSPVGRVNESLSAEAMALMADYVSRSGADRQRGMTLSHQLFRQLLRRVDRRVPGYRKPTLLPAARNAFLAASTDLDWLRDQYGIEWGADEHGPAGHIPTYGAALDIRACCAYDPARARRIARILPGASAG